MTKHLIACAIASTVCSASVHAYEFAKPIHTPVNINDHGQSLAGGSTKEVTVLKLKLSKRERQAMTYRKVLPQSRYQTLHSKLPSAIQLGMNNVPVLNQGRHGSCVTFAVSAALDAALDAGDYISQLCSLELGTHLERNGYMPSGWSGSYGPLVLNQMMRFGVVSKDVQREQSCADVKEYPIADGKNTGNEMGLTEYKSSSMNINNRIYWTHLFSNDQVFDWKTETPAKMQEVLMNTKKALADGNRVLFGTFLILGDKHCRAGACASFKAAKDTWALTEGLETPPYDVGGHEMVITGYDDTAVAYDDKGGQHTGLLTLRNSWGNDVGNNGDFYMSYDFFVKYANEVQVVKVIK